MILFIVDFQTSIFVVCHRKQIYFYDMSLNMSDLIFFSTSNIILSGIKLVTDTWYQTSNILEHLLQILGTKLTSLILL